MAAYLVTGPLAVVKVEGKQLYLYQGAAVPDGVDADELKRLEGRGLIGKPEGGDVLAADGETAAEKKRPAATRPADKA